MSVSEFLPSVARGANAETAKSSRVRWLLVGLGLVLLAALLWFGVQYLFPSKPHVAPPAPVRTARAVKQDVAVVQTTIATVVSPATVQVTAQVQGKLLQAYFQEGQLVHKGAPLFLIDPAPFQNALAQARAQLAKDTAMMQSALNDRLRYTALYAQNAISQQQRDQAVDDFIALVVAVDGILQMQAKSDAAYFVANCGRPVQSREADLVATQFLKAYRWQYILSGAGHPRFQAVLTSLVTEAQMKRVAGAVATLG